MRRFGWGHLMVLVIVGTLLWATGILWSAARAAEVNGGDDPRPPMQPHDCWNKALEDPNVAQFCRAIGWTVTGHLSISPHEVVREYDIKPCTFEDASGGPLPCGWNIGTMNTGNQRGFAYWVDRHRNFHYVWGTTPWPIVKHTAHWASKWERHHFGLDRTCWVKHPTKGRWVFQCPGDQVPD